MTEKDYIAVHNLAMLRSTLKSLEEVDEIDGIIEEEEYNYVKSKITSWRRDCNRLVIDSRTQTDIIEKDAKECLDALKYIEDGEIKDGWNGHKIGQFRPILLVKKLLNKIKQ